LRQRAFFLNFLSYEGKITPGWQSAKQRIFAFCKRLEKKSGL